MNHASFRNKLFLISWLQTVLLLKYLFEQAHQYLTSTMRARVMY